MNIKELLPIGTIVRLTEATKKIMIYGIKQTNMETGEEYDYVGVLYPEGNLGEKTQFLFNHEHVEEVVFMGYSDGEREDFINTLARIYEQKDLANKESF